LDGFINCPLDFCFSRKQLFFFLAELSFCLLSLLFLLLPETFNLLLLLSPFVVLSFNFGLQFGGGFTRKTFCLLLAALNFCLLLLLLES